MDGSLALYTVPVGACGPVRVLSLVIFLQETEEEEEEEAERKKKKKWPEGQKCLPQGFMNAISSIN